MTIFILPGAKNILRFLQVAALHMGLLLAGLWAQVEDHFPGYYINREAGLEVYIALPNGGRYAVTFTFQQKTYPGEATKLLGILQGTYAYQGNAVAFTISRILGQYFFTSEGVDVALEKKQAPASGTRPPQPALPSVVAIPINTDKAGGPAVQNAEAGYKVLLPVGWSATRLADGSYQASFNGDQNRLITIAEHQYADLNALIEASSSGTRQNGLEINLLSPVTKFGANGAMAYYQGLAGGQKFSFQALGLMSPHGGGITLGAFVLDQDQPSPELMKLLQTMANTVQWSKPQMPAIAQGWQQKLSGKQLLYLYTGNGLADKWSYDLCADGSYRYVNNSTYLSGNFNETFSAASQNAGLGRWKILTRQNQPVLVLISGNDEIQEFSLTVRPASNEVGMNGKRYFIQPAEHCR